MAEYFDTCLLIMFFLFFYFRMILKPVFKTIGGVQMILRLIATKFIFIIIYALLQTTLYKPTNLTVLPRSHLIFHNLRTPLYNIIYVFTFTRSYTYHVCILKQAPHAVNRRRVFVESQNVLNVKYYIIIYKKKKMFTINTWRHIFLMSYGAVFYMFIA